MSDPVIRVRAAQGLYHPEYEHDACGVAFVARLDGQVSHQIIRQGLEALANLDHRAAEGTDPAAGDGAGIMLQIPDRFLRAVVDFDLPAPGNYAMGLAFLPRDPAARASVKRTIEYLAIEEGLVIHGWRQVPTDDSSLSPVPADSMPTFEQLFVSGGEDASGLQLDRLVYPLRQRARTEVGVYFASLSSRTCVYKGMLTTGQVAQVFPDLLDERMESALALVHSRFSTSIFPAWELAHPFRLMAHNGEINSIQGNRAWMKAREARLATDLIPGDFGRLLPICTPGGSDSTSFDEVLELLHLGGRSLPHAILMMLPQAWSKDPEVDPALRAFYSFHSSLMEAWDGPASVTFTDGTQIGAMLDRNGLRPGRYWITADGLVVYASEAGVLDLDASQVVQKGTTRPGAMFLVDLGEHRVISDSEIKESLAAAAPYADWLAAGRIDLEQGVDQPHVVHAHSSVARRQQVFGYTAEDERHLIATMANTGADPMESGGCDTAIGVLAQRPRLLFDYFTQEFAQVTTASLDPVSEPQNTSLTAVFGPEGNLLQPGPASCRQVVIGYPVLDSDQLAKLVRLNRDGTRPDFESHVIHGLYEVAGGADALAVRLNELCAQVEAAIEHGCRTIILSDRHSTSELAPIPSLLLTSAIHQHLVRTRLRTQVGLIVEAGDAREVHHIAMLVAFGAAAVNPYLVFETAENLAREEWLVKVTPDQAVANLRRALGQGLLRVMARVGISSTPAYTGSQSFQALGLSPDFVAEYFAGTTRQLGGVGLSEIAADVASRHRRAYPAADTAIPQLQLPVGGDYRWRREGMAHQNDPESILALRTAVRTGEYPDFERFTRLVDDRNRAGLSLRGRLELNLVGDPIPIEEVEPVGVIRQRFTTAVLDSDTVGPDLSRLLADGTRQVPPDRTAVTSAFLAAAEVIQIGITEGRAPGESPTDRSVPGAYDLASLEDLKQLILDLVCANPEASIEVKLAAQAGIGTVVGGITKAKADSVMISSGDSGTRSATLTAARHAGGPWELGLAEAQQTLLLNGLRDRISLGVEGQLKTGWDVIVAILLGAERFGFQTAPLIAAGDVLTGLTGPDGSPIGIGPDGVGDAPTRVERFYEFLARQVREYLAELGYRSVAEAVGRVERLRVRDSGFDDSGFTLDLVELLQQVAPTPDAPRHRTVGQTHDLTRQLDHQLIEMSAPALNRTSQVSADLTIRNSDRSVGVLLGNRVTRASNGRGLEPGSIELTFRGTAGQSFGAFLPRGVTMRLIGDANDYLGKGLSGGRLVVRPARRAPFRAEEEVIGGDAIGYGATSGEMFLRGRVGERFCALNRGAKAVVEGVGDHALSYLGAGEVLILGPTGRNLAAGMSGGRAWVLDLFPVRLNPGSARIVPTTAAELVRIRALLQQHTQETGSEVALGLIGLPDAELASRISTLETTRGESAGQRPQTMEANHG